MNRRSHHPSCPFTRPTLWMALCALLWSLTGIPAVAQAAGQAPPPLPVADAGPFPIEADSFDPATGIYDANAAPQMAALPDGGYVAVWSRYTDGPDVVARRFDATDQPAGPRVRVNQQSGGSAPSAAAATDGSGFLVGWRSQTGYPAQLFVRRYDDQAAPVGSEQRIDGGLAGGGSPDVALSGSGGLAVWAGGPDYAGFRIFGRLLDADGVPVGGPFALQTSTALFVGHPAVAPDGAGGYLVVWRQKRIGQDGGTVLLRHVGADGTPIGDPSVVFDTEDRLPMNPAIGAGPDGRFVVAWNDCPDFGSPGTCGVRMQAFEAPGQTLRGPRILEGSDELYAREPSVSVDASGNQAVTWPWCAIGGTYPPACGLETIYFGARGERLGVVRPDLGSGEIPSQASNAAVHGDFLLGWTGIGANPEGAYGQRHRLIERGRGRR